jgi:alanyl aminopeptidase
MRKFLAVLLTLLATPILAADPIPPQLRLGDVAAPKSYEVQLAIDPREGEFTGEVRIAFRVNRRTPILWLNATDLRIDRVEMTQGERRLNIRVIKGGEDFVGFEAEGAPFFPGDALAVIRYRGDIESSATRGIFRQLDGGEWYAISQFESMSARRAFPCFDEPGWKVPWQLTIDTLAANEVASNSPETLAFDLPGRPGWKRHVFARTKPLPSYLVALAVGPFDVVGGGTAGINHTPLRYFTPKGRAIEARFAKESTPRLLELLEQYFGMPYPYEKLDSVTIPAAVGFGAMENAGMITYSSSLLLARGHEETLEFKRRYAAVGAHEMAHMWFGDLVTPMWWDDIWLNEAFATWMARKVLASYNPEYDAGWRRGESRRRAITADQLVSARRIHNPITNKDDVSAAFDRITYDKGAEVLAMFETWLGPDRFQQGVRDYFKKHAWGNATSRDFFGAIGKAAGRSESALKAFEAFVDQPGIPLVDVALRCEGVKVSMDVSQQRLRTKGSTAPDLHWTTPACFRYRADGEVKTQCVEIGNERRNVVLAGAKSCPDWLVGNAGGRGHWVARYEASLARRNTEHLDELPANEAMTLAFDTSLLAGAGLMPVDSALRLSDALLRNPSAAVKTAGVFLVEKQRDVLLTPAQMDVKREILAKRIQPLAREVGWNEHGGDSDDVHELRVLLLPYAARSLGGEGLRPEARELALRWAAKRDSVPAAMAQPILDTAARFADDATYAKLEDTAFAMRRINEKTMILKALAKVHDPALRDRAFSLALRKAQASDAIGGRDTYNFIEQALEDEDNQLAAFAYVRTNWDSLVAKFPPETPARLTTPLATLCTPQERATFHDFFQDRSPQFLGGAQRYQQALESIDICNAVYH